MKILLIIIAHNNSETILNVVDEVKASGIDIELLVIDRNSGDRTLNLLKNNDINYLHIPTRSTYSNAVSLGLQYARFNEFDGAIEFPADETIDSVAIEKFLNTIRTEDPDFIIGSRFVNKIPYKNGNMASKWMSFILLITRRKKIYDPLFNLKYYKNNLFYLYKNDSFFGHHPDSIGRLLKSNVKYSQVFVPIDGNKNINHIVGFQMLVFLIRQTFMFLFIQPFLKKVKYKGEK